MGILRDGAHQLGLNTTWRYAFVRPGLRVEGTHSAVYLDVGGQLSPGVIDQHSDQSLGDCTSHLIIRYPESVYHHLLGDWLRRRDDGQALAGRPFCPRIVTHTAPDFDAVASTLLAMHLVEEGDLPPWAEGLAAYSAVVDQGRYRMELRESALSDTELQRLLSPVHLAYLALQHIEAPAGTDRDTWHMERGLQLIRAELESLTRVQDPRRLSAQSFMPGSPGVGGWRQVADFQDIVQALDTDWPRHVKDWESAEHVPLTLPDRTLRHSISVTGLIMRRAPEARLHKYWCRARNRPFTLTPLSDGTRGLRNDIARGAAHHAVVIIAVDAEWQDESRRRLSLRGLGSHLEALECATRAGEAGGDTRGRVPRYPGVTNDDPWYDGWGHDFTIVDVPRTGTHLSLDSIIDVATKKRFWETQITDVELIVIDRSCSVEPRPVGPSRKVQPPVRTVAPMKSWFAESSEVPEAAPRSLVGLTGESCSRSFPQETCGPMTIVTYRAGGAGAPTLEMLANAVAALRDAGELSGSPPLTIVLRYRPLEGVPTDYLDYWEKHAVGCELKAIAGYEDPTETGRLRVGAQGVVERLGTTHEGAPANENELREAAVYCLFLYETLNAYSERIASALQEAKRPLREQDRSRSAAKVRELYLQFQAMHYQLVVSQSPLVQGVQDRMRTLMSIELTHAEVARELERLAEYEQQLASERQISASQSLNRLMALVSLTAVMQTSIAIVALEHYAQLFDRTFATLWILGWTALVFYFWWRSYRAALDAEQP